MEHAKEQVVWLSCDFVSGEYRKITRGMRQRPIVMKYIFIEVFQTEFLSFGTKKYRIQGLWING